MGKKRRAHGEGTIYKRSPSGRGSRWQGQITVAWPEDGRTKRVSVYGRSEQEVREKLRDLIARRDAGTLPSESAKTPAGAYLTRWLDDAKRSTIEESTYTLYAGALRKHIAPKIGGVPLTALHPGQIQAFLSGLEREGVGAGIREVIYRLLHAAFEQAVAWNLIPRNPMKGVLKPRSPRREMQTLTAEGAARFLEAATGDRYHAAYAILIGCGLRLGEVLGLGWPDVDFNRGTLSIRRQLSKITQQLKDLKTSGSRRTVQMPAFVADALRHHQERMRAEGSEITDHLLIFVNEERRPVHADNFRRRSFHRLLATIGVAATNKKKGILGLRVHDLRHTMATLARKAGVDIQVISRSLGHSKPSITWNVYSHIEPSMPEADAAKIDALFAQKPSERSDLLRSTKGGDKAT